jgi:hypothetical protein
VAILLIGLVSGRYWMVLAGIVTATLARQTAIPVAFAAGYWVGFGTGWRDVRPRRRWTQALGVVIAPICAYIVLTRVAASFSYETTPSFTHFTLLADLARLPTGAGSMVNHLLRCVNSLVAVAALISVSVVARRRCGAQGTLPFAAVGGLLVGAAIAIQPVVLSPQYVVKNETRLAALALGSFIFALSVLLRERERAGFHLTARRALAIVAVLALGSLHHIYTVVGLANATQTVTLQVVTAIAAGVLLWEAMLLPRRVSQGGASEAGT